MACSSASIRTRPRDCKFLSDRRNRYHDIQRDFFVCYPERSEGSLISRWITLISLRAPDFDCEIPRFARDDSASNAARTRISAVIDVDLTIPDRVGILRRAGACLGN